MEQDIDTSVAHSARVHDYWLGGTDNFAADRAAGDAVIQAYPGIVASVRANRAFLARVVSFLAAEAGIRQFLDLGTGIPAANNTHQVAQAAAGCRVVYVDHDPVVLRHARALLASAPPGTLDYIDADLRDPPPILARAADPGFLPPGRGHADRRHAPDRRPGRPGRHHRAADGGGPGRELPGAVPGGVRHRGGPSVQPPRPGDPAAPHPRRGGRGVARKPPG
jgi:hypothetical protein